MPRHSAALLAHWHGPPDGQVPDGEVPDGQVGQVHVLIGHMGGPYWARRDAGAWSIPKGEFDPAAEDPADAAVREFVEETGIALPEGPLRGLGTFRQPSGKLVHAFARRFAERLPFVASNTFEMPWPPGSGRVASFPEIDRAEWVPLVRARRLVVPGQVPILDALGAPERDHATDRDARRASDPQDR